MSKISHWTSLTSPFSGFYDMRNILHVEKKVREHLIFEVRFFVWNRTLNISKCYYVLYISKCYYD